ARNEALHDLDLVHGRAADLDRDAHRIAAAFDELEEADRRVRLTVHGSPRVHDVREPLDLDRAVDRQIRPRAARQLSDQLDVDLHRAVAYRRVDPDHAAVDYPV